MSNIEMDAEPSPSAKEDTQDIEVGIRDVVTEEHEDFLSVRVTRKVSFYYNGKNNAPTYKLIHQLMEKYNIPDDANMSSEMNWDDIGEQREQAIGLKSGPSKRWFDITFTFPLTLEEMAKPC